MQYVNMLLLYMNNIIKLKFVYLPEGKYWLYPQMVAFVIPPGLSPDWRNFQNSNIKWNDCWSENDSETNVK